MVARSRSRNVYRDQMTLTHSLLEHEREQRTAMDVWAQMKTVVTTTALNRCHTHGRVRVMSARAAVWPVATADCSSPGDSNVPGAATDANKQP